MTENKEEFPTAVPKMIPDHSHDSIYLVYNHGGGKWFDYESCHHCSFIRVPEIDSLKEQLKVAVEALDRIKNDPPTMFGSDMVLIAKDALEKIKGMGGMK